MIAEGMVRQSGGGQTPDSPQCHVLLSDPLASKQTAALNHQVPGAHKQAQAPEPYITHPPRERSAEQKPAFLPTRPQSEPGLLPRPAHYIHV